MITIFSTPKPFRGHIGVIQRNALKSWTLLHPDVEMILFGDERARLMSVASWVASRAAGGTRRSGIETHRLHVR